MTDNKMLSSSSGDVLIGVSACLLGEKVRYDAGHKHQNYITDTLGKFFTFRSFCPEMAIGLGAPRETIKLVQQGDQVRCVGTKTSSLDVTDKLSETAQEQREWHQDLCGYILKKGSPSCGMERVKLYGLNSKDPNMPQNKGVGLYAKGLMENFPQLPVEEEGRLGDPVLRENFVQRVFVYRHWKALSKNTMSLKSLTDFHAQYKYTLMSHEQNRARSLGKTLSNISGQDIDDIASTYFSELMSILKIKATRQNHVNVLQHIQGYLKNDLDKGDKQELTETVDSYRQGMLPLIVPITLLRHYFRRHPKPYIEESKYLSPHPSELMLLNYL